MSDLGPDPAARTKLRDLFTRIFGWRPVRFLFVGGVSVIVDFGLLWLLHELFGIVLWLAAGTSFLASCGVNYALQRSVSFASDAPHGPSLVKYALLVIANTIVTSVLVQLFANLAVGWAVGKLITTGITSVVNYFVYRHWIFPTDNRLPNR